MDISQALTLLDPTVDEHWTSDGLPRMDAIVELTGDTSITRKAVTDAAPSLTRSTALERAAGEDDMTEDTEPEEEPTEAPEEAPEPEIDEEAPAVAEPDHKPGLRGPTIIESSALDLPVRDVLNDAQLTLQAISEIDGKVAKALQAKKAIERELAQLYQKNEILKRQAIIHERAAPKKSTGVKAYLAAQQRAREERAARAQAFIAAGTTQADVAEAMRPGSKLDAVMNRRKAGPGSVRPPARLMNTTGT